MSAIARAVLSTDTGLFVGHVPGWPGAHSHGESLDELQRNLQEVVSMLLEEWIEMRSSGPPAWARTVACSHRVGS